MRRRPALETPPAPGEGRRRRRRDAGALGTLGLQPFSCLEASWGSLRRWRCRPETLRAPRSAHDRRAGNRGHLPFPAAPPPQDPTYESGRSRGRRRSRFGRRGDASDKRLAKRKAKIQHRSLWGERILHGELPKIRTPRHHQGCTCRTRTRVAASLQSTFAETVSTIA